MTTADELGELSAAFNQMVERPRRAGADPGGLRHLPRQGGRRVHPQRRLRARGVRGRGLGPLLRRPRLHRLRRRGGGEGGRRQPQRAVRDGGPDHRPPRRPRGQVHRRRPARRLRRARAPIRTTPTAPCEPRSRSASDRQPRRPGPLEVGVGVNSGPVVAGSIGGAGRLNFSVIGDAVNVAARVEAATRESRRRGPDHRRHPRAALGDRSRSSPAGRRAARQVGAGRALGAAGGRGESRVRGRRRRRGREGEGVLGAGATASAAGSSDACPVELKVRRPSSERRCVPRPATFLSSRSPASPWRERPSPRPCAATRPTTRGCCDADLEPPRYDDAHRCLHREQPGTRALARWLDRHFRGASWGIYRCEKLCRRQLQHPRRGPRPRLAPRRRRSPPSAAPPAPDPHAPGPRPRGRADGARAADGSPGPDLQLPQLVGRDERGMDPTTTATGATGKRRRHLDPHRGPQGPHPHRAELGRRASATSFWRSPLSAARFPRPERVGSARMATAEQRPRQSAPQSTAAGLSPRRLKLARRHPPLHPLRRPPLLDL